MTVLFLHFEGLDYIHDVGAGEKLNQYVGLVQRAVDALGGYLIKLTIDDKGSYLLITFGAPLTHENPTQSAVAAALALHAPEQVPDFITAVRIGISRGRMLAGAFGSEKRAAYDLLGDDASLANRLMKLAVPGQTLTTAEVETATQARFRFTCIGKKTLKGLPAPIPVYQLEERMALHQVAHEGEIVGRGRELQRLRQWQANVANGRGFVVQIEGVAGVGKSRLVAEFVQGCRHNGFAIGTGPCESTTQTTPYFPWRQLLLTLLVKDFAPDGEHIERDPADVARQVTNAVVALDPNWRARTSLLNDILQLPFADSPLSTALGPQEHQSALIEFVVDLLCTLAKLQPLLVVFEDVQWMDEASQSLMVALARAAEQHRLMVLQVMRPLQERQAVARTLRELRHLTRCEQIALAPLADDDLETLIQSELQGQIQPLLLDLIRTRAQGNPYFVKEFVGTLREIEKVNQATGKKAEGKETADEEAADEETVGKKALDGKANGGGLWVLARETEEELRRADCLEKDLESGLPRLKKDAPLSKVDLGIPTQLDQLVVGRLGRLPEAHQMTLKMASVIGRAFSAALLSKAHTSGDGDERCLQNQLDVLVDSGLLLPDGAEDGHYQFNHQITQEALYDTLRAGQRQELHGSVGDALEQLEPQAVERLAMHFQLAQRREKQLLYLGQAAFKSQREFSNQTALNFFNQALELDERAEWLQGKVEVLHILGQREEEQETIDRLYNHPSASEFQTTLLQSKYEYAIGEYATARQHGLHARQIARDLSNKRGQLDAEKLLCLIDRYEGEFQQAIERTAKIQPLFDTLSTEEKNNVDQVKTELQINLGNVYREQGNYAKAQAEAQVALRIARENGNQRGEANALNVLAAVAHYQRDYDQALRLTENILHIQRKIGDLAGEAFSLYNFGSQLHDAGVYDVAEKYLTDAVKICTAIHEQRHKLEAHNVLGLIYYECGDMLQANNELQHGLRISRQIGDVLGAAFLQCNLGIVLRDSGKPLPAEQQFKASLQVATEHKNLFLQAMCMSHLALLQLYNRNATSAIQLALSARALRLEIGTQELTTIDLTTLAQASHEIGQHKEALGFIAEAQSLLAFCQNQGPEFPHWDHFRCFQVLSANKQKADAISELQTAFELLTNRAESFRDETRRTAFLQKGPVNGEIWQSACLLLGTIVHDRFGTLARDKG